MDQRHQLQLAVVHFLLFSVNSIHMPETAYPLDAAPFRKRRFYSGDHCARPSSSEIGGRSNSSGLARSQVLLDPQATFSIFVRASLIASREALSEIILPNF